MQKILGISSVFIGLVIGAGFASGREIFEYFNRPSSADFTGIVIAAISFGAICYIIMHLAQKCKSPDFDSLINAISGRFAPAVKLFMTVFMFCGFFIMMSACGVLTEEIFGFPRQWGVWLLALVCFGVFAFDVKGLVAFNTVLVPLMLAGMVFICLSSMYAAQSVFSAFDSIRYNPIVSSLCYVSYNTVTAGAVLVPLSAAATKKQIAAASIISGGVLGLLIYIAWLCMNLFFDRLALSEMPLLVLASENGQLTTIIYTLVLFMALCTTAVSQGFGILSKFSFRKTSHRIIGAAVLCLSAMPFAKFGFSALVSNLYSAFGYVGLMWTVVVIWKYIKN